MFDQHTYIVFAMFDGHHQTVSDYRFGIFTPSLQG